MATLRYIGPAERYSARFKQVLYPGEPIRALPAAAPSHSATEQLRREFSDPDYRRSLPAAEIPFDLARNLVVAFPDEFIIEAGAVSDATAADDEQRDALIESIALSPCHSERSEESQPSAQEETNHG